MTLTDQVVKNIIKRLIKGQDYRIEVVNIINAEFLDYAISFFKKVIDAKLNDTKITPDWYLEYLSNTTMFSPDEISIHLGLNKKTITNMYNTASKQVVLDASLEHYNSFCSLIEELIETENEVDLELTLAFKGVSVKLNINESLIVINALAVKRAALRGGAWSTAGKRVEKYLMATLCKIYNVPFEHFDQSKIPASMREVDFYLIKDRKYHRCEVKMMGRGNPESADAIFARESDVFVADKLSDLNKQQADMLNVKWVELRNEVGYKRFAKVLTELEIPHTDFQGDLDAHLDRILNDLLD